MAIQQITYSDKVDLNTTSVADINKVNASDLNTIKSVVNNNASFIGKTLWEGSFSSGTISVPGISEYTMICILAGSLLMVGNQRYGGMVFRTYRSTTTSSYGYRYTYNATNNTLTIDTDNAGATDGTNNVAITKIIGVF
jgi:hypothetical protein